MKIIVEKKKKKKVIAKNNIAIRIAGKVSPYIDASMNRATPSDVTSTKSWVHAITDRHSPTAKINLNWRKENHTLCVPIWQNLKFHIRRRFIFHIGVRYKTIRIIYTLSEMWHSCMESYKTLKRNFYNNFYMAVSQNLTKPYYFLLAKSAKANWIWLESFLPSAKMAIAFRCLEWPQKSFTILFTNWTLWTMPLHTMSMSSGNSVFSSGSQKGHLQYGVQRYTTRRAATSRFVFYLSKSRSRSKKIYSSRSRSSSQKIYLSKSRK